ncbi:MAG: hypothetical protein PXY39_08810 [archaeon]|jgi:flagellin-like protein|nr:hypothetical protein [archaeon]
MDRIELFNRLKRERRSAISPIIATLLLILIAIAAGVVVYAYVLGFVGNSTNNSGATTSIISIANFCVEASVSTKCSGSQYYISLQNTGSVSIAGGAVLQLYLSDINSGANSVISCTLSSALNPSNSVSLPSGCSSTSGSLPSVSAGDTLNLKLVAPDGGTAISSVKAIA